MQIGNEDAIKKMKHTIIAIIFVVVIGFFVYVPLTGGIKTSELPEKTYKSFLADMDSGNVNTVYYTDEVSTIYVLQNDETYYKISNPKYEKIKETILNNDVFIKPVSDLRIAENIETSRKSLLYITLSFLLIRVLVLYASTKSPEGNTNTIVLGKKKASAGPGNAKVRSSNANIEESVSVKTFNDIAGLKEVKKDMACLVDFLKNKDKYEEAGAKLPKGVILYGPPGTGKTLLAKAVAGEAEVPFLYMSGSEFVELYVGVGAKRVRELFAMARRFAPCIVFIDEIDSIGGKREDKGSNGEDRKTINALLTEMDGFKETENIIVIGATNRLEDLDSALTRPGRFTNKYCVPLPETVEERLEIIKMYGKNKKFDDTFDAEALAKETVGFSPAKIEALLNEASIISVQDHSPCITKKIVDKAMYKILLQGHMREDNTKRDDEELKVVAWHEAGHAVIGHLFGKDITKVTVIPSTSGAGGVTFSSPTKTNLLSAEDLKHEIMELYGGRLAELMLYCGDKNKITTGASNDIERATELIHAYVTSYGMAEDFGMLNLSSARFDNSEIVKSEVSLAKELEEKTYAVLKDNVAKLETIAKMLIERNTVYNTDIVEVFKKCA